jgi:hypothetical protein
MRKTTVQEQPIKQIEKETWTNIEKEADAETRQLVKRSSLRGLRIF